jgi:hypothetical protein
MVAHLIACTRPAAIDVSRAIAAVVVALMYLLPAGAQRMDLWAEYAGSFDSDVVKPLGPLLKVGTGLPVADPTGS